MYVLPHFDLFLKLPNVGIDFFLPCLQVILNVFCLDCCVSDIL